MTSSSPLLIDLAGVARLADVQRPVATMWRKRFASTDDPFPEPASVAGGRVLFDAMPVAHWLVRTKHGNNPDAAADAAAAGVPAGFDIANAGHVASVDALLALRATTGASVGNVTMNELHRRARVIDPEDSCLLSELPGLNVAWATWADLLADAAYSPLQASRLLEQRHAATMSAAGVCGPLAAKADALLIALAEALTAERRTDLVISEGITPSLAASIVSQISDDVDLVIPSTSEARAIRRRLLCDGAAMPRTQADGDADRTVLMRLPAKDARTASAMVNALDEIVLGMRDRDRAIVIAPASILIEPLARAEALARTDVLRSGRVRAIVKLPAGLLTASPREALALWVLGRETGDVPVDDRFTAVADLTDTALTPAARADLSSDVLAAMGSHREVRAHAFRFTRLVRTTMLLASNGALISQAKRLDIAPVSAQDVPALLDQALVDLGDYTPRLVPTTTPGARVPTAQVEDLIAERHLRLISGSRIAPEDISGSGLVVVTATDLDGPRGIGERRIDPLSFAARYPSARLTEPGDVVFRSSPTARAWVDAEGSKVVAYPARILRIDSADPGGLVPELVAADIDGSVSGPASWHRWRLRRVAPAMMKMFRTSLADLASRRNDLERRIAALDVYTELLSSGITSGAVTLTDNAAADVATDSQ